VNPLVRQAPIKPRATKRKPQLVAEVSEWIGERPARDGVEGRSGGWCEMRVDGVCFGSADNWCHRIAQGQGGLWQASNGLAGCGSGTTGCHGWCHANPAAAQELGWMLLSTAKPLLEPAYIHTIRFGLAWVLLRDDGDVSLAPSRASASSPPGDQPEGGVA
jgi:hypothetical protein